MKFFSHRLRHAIRACGVASIACLLIAPQDVGAQQSCRTPTPDAENAINRILGFRSDSLWFRSRGIMARSVAGLQVMRDSADGALCLRLDSLVLPPVSNPKYYYRAGPYVVATDARPLADPITGVLHISERTRVLVLNATTLMPGDMSSPPVAAPADLHATIAVNGLVELRWTTPLAAGADYHLQRAVGSGSFSYLGAALPGNAASITDTTVLNGNTYHYRIVGSEAGADTGYSNVVTVTISDVGTIALATAGKLFSDDFNRPDGDLGPDWTTFEGMPFRIIANRAVPPAGAVPGASDFMRLTNAVMTPVSTVCMQADLTTNTGGGAPMIGTQVTTGTNWTGWLLFLHSAARDVLYFYSVIDLVGAEVFRSPQGAYAERVVQNTKLCTGNGSQRAWLNGQLKMDITSTALDGVAGTVGIRDGGDFPQDGEFDNVIVTRSNSVSITGLPANYKFRIGGLTSAAATSGGTVTLDLQGVRFPATNIEFLDAGGALVKQYVPAAGIWGGDEFSFTPTP